MTGSVMEPHPEDTVHGRLSAFPQDLLERSVAGIVELDEDLTADGASKLFDRNPERPRYGEPVLSYDRVRVVRRSTRQPVGCQDERDDREDGCACMRCRSGELVHPGLPPL